jgi:hypothetical protein
MSSFMQFDAPGYRLGTKEEGLAWVLAELRDLREWRARIDIDCNNPDKRRGDLRRDFWKFLVRQGKVAGILMTLHRISWITAEQYVQILADANATLIGVSNKLRE